MPAEQVERNVRLLKEAGLSVIRNQDMTSNVLLSCEGNAKQRTGSQGIAKRADADMSIADIGDFIALPGSKKYQEMRNGAIPNDEPCKEVIPEEQGWYFEHDF